MLDIRESSIENFYGRGDNLGIFNLNVLKNMIILNL